MTTCYNLEHRIFYVHIPKCAGTSIGGIVNDHGQWSDCWLEENLPGWTRDGLPNGHQPVRNIEAITGKPIDWWQSILITIRNPFAQQVSQWEFWRNRGLEGAAKGWSGHPDDQFAASCTFGQFVVDGRSNGPNACCGDNWRRCGGVYRWWAMDSSGLVPQNVTIVRTEDISSGELAHWLCRWTGDQKITDLPVLNKATQRPWQEYYDEEIFRSVARKFGWSLACFYQELLDYNAVIAKSDCLPAQ